MDESFAPATIVETLSLADQCVRSRERCGCDPALAVEGALLQGALRGWQQVPGPRWAAEVIMAKVRMCAGRGGRAQQALVPVFLSLVPGLAPGDSAVHRWVSAAPDELDRLPGWMEEHIRRRLRVGETGAAATWPSELIERLAPAANRSADPIAITLDAEERAELAWFISNVLGPSRALELRRRLGAGPPAGGGPPPQSRTAEDKEFANLTDRLFAAWLVWRAPRLRGLGTTSRRALLKTAYAKLHRPGWAGSPPFRQAKHAFVQGLRQAS